MNTKKIKDIKDDLECRFKPNEYSSGDFIELYEQAVDILDEDQFLYGELVREKDYYEILHDLTMNLTYGIGEDPWCRR